MLRNALFRLRKPQWLKLPFFSKTLLIFFSLENIVGFWLNMTKPSLNQNSQWRGSYFFEQNSVKSTTVKLKTNEWPQSRASTLFGWDRNNWNNISGFFLERKEWKETFCFYLNWPPGEYLHLRLELNLSCLGKIVHDM